MSQYSGFILVNSSTFGDHSVKKNENILLLYQYLIRQGFEAGIKGYLLKKY
jgi:hypothetical protein